MPKKPVLEGGKREEIVKAALDLFLTKGYDGTSVRAIMNQAGGEVGLFYYYFKNKDDVFDKVLDLFFSHYAADFAHIVEHGRRNPCRLMQDFFEYMEIETDKFRKQYADKMHRTMRWAIREHTLTLIEPYLEQIVEIQSDYYGVEPSLEKTVAALYLTHGVGSYILHEDHEKYWIHRAEVKRGTSLIMGMSAMQQELRTPYPATDADIEGCMELVSNVADSFPGLDEMEYKKKLKEYIECDEAWVYRNDGKVVAVLLFSKERKELDFLAVHPDFRQRGLASRLIETMAAQFPVGTQLSVTTYCKGDPMDVGATALYKQLGFIEGECVQAFGHQCQKMILTVLDKTPV